MTPKKLATEMKSKFPGIFVWRNRLLPTAMTVRIAPINQPAAFRTGVLLRLTLHPRRHTLRLHRRKVGYHSLVVTDTVFIVLMAEGLQAGAGKLRAFIAANHPMFLGTRTESIPADSAVRRQFIRQATVAIVGIAGTGAAEKPTDSGGLFVRFHVVPPVGRLAFRALSLSSNSLFSFSAAARMAVLPQSGQVSTSPALEKVKLHILLVHL